MHLISFIASRVSELSGIAGARHAGLDLVEDPFPLVEVKVKIRLNQSAAPVNLESAHAEIEFTVADGYLSTSATILDSSRSSLSLRTWRQRTGTFF